MGLIALIFAVWLLAGLCALGLNLLATVPAIIYMPAYPFVVAYRMREEDPAGAKRLCLAAGSFYAVVMLSGVALSLL